MRGIKNTAFSLLPGRLSSRISRLGLEHKQIARGVLLVGFFVLIGKVAGAGKEMAVAWRYGISETVDAYLFVFSLTQWPVNILGGVIGSVLVPLATRVQNEAPLTLPRFRSELLGATICVSCGIGFAACILLPWIVQQSWIGLATGQIELARQMAPYLAWVIPLAIIAQLFAAWTMAANRHTNTLLEGMPAVAILAAVLVAGGIMPLVWGTLVGFALQVVLLYLPLSWRGEAEKPNFFYRSSHWRIFAAGLGFMMVGQALSTLTTLLDQFFAARLGSGAISTLGYANRILALLLGLGAIAISRAILPVLSRAFSEGKVSITRITGRWTVLLSIAGILLMVLGIWLAPAVVKLLFQRGKFTADDSIRVTELLRYAMVQIPFYFFSMVLVYTLLSQGRQKMVALIGGINLLTKIILALILVPFLGLNGLILSTAGVYLVSGLVATWMLWFEANRKT